eukprot:comp22228_c0_seq1/m.32771 comp22228_c0_seq1/g.32771  ORF comp22228_c0_seq1/g.32771 comp22228_c0_seq1/m.32771 type:complete len:470 (-) comp22228_c0_seq1:16-1425(-)
MPRLQEKYISSIDGLQLLYRSYGQEGADWKPKASLCLVHGFGEHSDRFTHVCESFVELDVAVHTVDLRGHGYSGGGRADGQFEDILKDIGVLLQRADPHLPLYLYGHSMGGMAVLRYIQTHPHSRIDGAIVASPLLALSKPIGPVRRMLLELVYPVMGEFLISSGVDPCGLSSVHEEVTKVFHDRLTLPFMTVRFGRELLRNSAETLRHPELIDVPVFFVHGSRDLITCPKSTTDFSQRVATDDVTLYIVEGGVHELHNDLQQDHVIQTMGEWLVDRIAHQQSHGNKQRSSRSRHRVPSQRGPSKVAIVGGGKAFPAYAHSENANGGMSESKLRVMRLLQALVLVMWFVPPVALFMFPVHVVYLLVCKYLLDYEMGPQDMAKILVFGALHMATLAAAQKAGKSEISQVGEVGGSVYANGDMGSESKERLLVKGSKGDMFGESMGKMGACRERDAESTPRSASPAIIGEQ